MAQHPYYPLGLELPGFVPQLLGFDVILGVFFAGFAALFLATWLVSGPRGAGLGDGAARAGSAH